SPASRLRPSLPKNIELIAEKLFAILSHLKPLSIKRSAFSHVIPPSLRGELPAVEHHSETSPSNGKRSNIRYVCNQTSDFSFLPGRTARHVYRIQTTDRYVERPIPSAVITRRVIGDHGIDIRMILRAKDPFASQRRLQNLENKF